MPIRHGDAQDLGAVVLVQVERKPTPAAADVEHAQRALALVRALHGELGGQVRLLVALGVFEAVGRVAVVAHGVLAILVEEQLVEAAATAKTSQNPKG